jgi:hypothetical protein
MSAVYLADQKMPVELRVALKVIKLGMDTREVVARFEAERQALAVMDHPGIAREFDGGSTAAGRPFYVNELVEGEPMTQQHVLGAASPASSTPSISSTLSTPSTPSTSLLPALEHRRNKPPAKLYRLTL